MSIPYQGKGDGSEVGSAGAGKGKLEAQGESAPCTRPAIEGFRGHCEAGPGGGAHVPIIKLNNIAVLNLL